MKRPFLLCCVLVFTLNSASTRAAQDEDDGADGDQHEDGNGEQDDHDQDDDNGFMWGKNGERVRFPASCIVFAHIVPSAKVDPKVAYPDVDGSKLRGHKMPFGSHREPDGEYCLTSCDRINMP